ncbi:MAG: type II toxin-antitoxin system RelE/ParE family toxin [bacterium]
MLIKSIPKTLEIYQNTNGKEPIIEWLESIKDITTKARIKNRLRRMELGILGDYKNISSGLFELRLKFGSGYRVYFGEIDNKIILLLCGGDKSSQTKDIKKAKEYWQEYKNNN